MKAVLSCSKSVKFTVSSENDKMFTKIATALAVIFIANQASSFQVGKVGVDLWQQAQEKMEQLRTIVDRTITEGDNSLKTLSIEASDHSNQVRISGLKGIADEQATLNNDLDSIKSLAQESGVDITRCLRYNEPKLNDLPKKYGDALTACISDQVNKGNTDITNYKYKIDNSVVSVNDLDHQLNLCGHDDFLCISTIIKQANRLIQQIPTRINLDVSEAKNLIDMYKASMEDCSTAKIGEYDSAGNVIINDIQQCAFS